MKTAVLQLSLAIIVWGTASTAFAAKAVFAGGCFWCVESDFEKVDGVIAAVSGYTGGHTQNPTYKQVGRNNTGHYEAVEVEYDPDKVSYEELLEVFWRNIDPFDDRGQFCDKGSSYLSAIFVLDESQRVLANESLQRVVSRFKGKTVVTPILDAKTFYPAEDYHQDYYKRNSVRYNYYRWGCGRDKRLQAIWGKND